MDRILAQPLMQLRLELKQAYKDRKFDPQQFDDFLARLRDIGISGKLEKSARAVVEKRAARDVLDIELNTPAKQLLWAAVLTRMQDDDKGLVEHSVFWQQIRQSIGVHNESIMVSRLLTTLVRNEDVTFSWGGPGSWFYYSPQKNHINLDLYFMLMTGFEHVRAIHAHEIGHSELSAGSYTPRMRELYEKIKTVIDPTTVNDGGAVAPPKLKREEQLALARDVCEWQLLHRAWNMMEDICVDQFAINLTRRMPQDYGYALNHAAMLLRGYAEILGGDKNVRIKTDEAPSAEKDGIIDGPQDGAGQEENARAAASRPLPPETLKVVAAGDISPDIAHRMFTQITHAALLSGYAANGLFTDKKENWERFGVFAEDIDSLVDVSHIKAAEGKTAFEYLMQVAGGEKDSIRQSQPTLSDRLLVREGYGTTEESYRATVAALAERRAGLMAAVWDVYLKPYADVIIDAFQKELEESLDRKKQHENRNDPSGQGQQGEGKSQGNRQGAGQGGGSGRPDGGADETADGNEDEARQNGAGSQENADEGEELDENLKKQIGRVNKDPSEGQRPEETAADTGRKKESGWGADPAAGGMPAPINAGERGAEMPVDEPDSDDAGRNAQGNEGQGGHKSNAPSSPVAGGGDSINMDGGIGRGVDFTSLAKGNWQDFTTRMAELAPVVNRVARAYAQIRKSQMREITRMAKTHDFIAPDGDVMGRLDRDKMLDLKFRRATRQKVTQDDFKRFYDDKSNAEFSTIEMVYMIDGSGSMPQLKLAGGVTAMEAALQSAAIGYMACRKSGIDSYIVIWGDPSPITIATPDSDLKTVGECLEALRNGTRSGTALAPGIVETIGRMAAHRNKNGTVSGSSHVLVFSDGDIGDAGPAAAVLDAVGRSRQNLSIDVAVLKPDHAVKTKMETLFENAIGSAGGRQLGIVRGQNPQEIPQSLARLMLRRVRGMRVQAEPDSVKRDKLKKLHRKLDT